MSEVPLYVADVAFSHEQEVQEGVCPAGLQFSPRSQGI